MSDDEPTDTDDELPDEGAVESRPATDEDEEDTDDTDRDADEDRRE